LKTSALPAIFQPLFEIPCWTLAKRSDTIEMIEETMADTTPKEVCVTVDPGICGFPCVIKAEKMDSQAVAMKIKGSGCEQIKKLSEHLPRILLKELFAPIRRNPVYLLSEKSSCHLSCPVPVAVIKAAEAALGLALPRNVRIRFVPCEEQTADSGQDP
jgi:hypothetical protein